MPDGSVVTFERVIADRFGWGESVHFGFVAKETAEAWFAGWWDALANDGFRLASFDVDVENCIVAQSGQAAFVR